MWFTCSSKCEDLGIFVICLPVMSVIPYDIFTIHRLFSVRREDDGKPALPTVRNHRQKQSGQSNLTKRPHRRRTWSAAMWPIIYFTMCRPFPLKIAPYHVISRPPSNTRFPEPTRAHNPNGISIGSAVFVRLTTTSDRPTDHDTRSVRIDRIYVGSTAMRPNNNNEKELRKPQSKERKIPTRVVSSVNCSPSMSDSQLDGIYFLAGNWPFVVNWMCVCVCVLFVAF